MRIIGTISLPESIINSICEEISENYKKDNSFLPYFLRHKSNLDSYLDSFNKENFVKAIIERINNNRQLNLLGEPVAELALSYFHKLSNDAITFNDTVRLYFKPGNYDEKDYKKMINSLLYRNMNNILILDVILKEYLQQTNSILHLWKATIDFENLYFEFTQSFDAHDIEYSVDRDMLCIFKPEIQGQAIHTEIPSNENSNQLLYRKLLYVDSNYINLSIDDVKTILEKVTITGTIGIAYITENIDKDEYKVDVNGTNLDPLFKNKYRDPERLLTNFMCRNDTVNSMSCFDMNIKEYSFISRLSFEDPYIILHDFFYDIDDNLTSVSSKLITGYV
ncbi:hypothetical protein H8356DRAFT_1426531 [Neocallimastix lanati (nom. inval.)]|nr:hypothetical protein H8356DRAFT_1426531 [Neocallimastix sp. JGI-2020a]